MVALYRELDALSQRYRNDEQAKDAILHLGSAIIALINQDLGRLQGGAIDQKVRETVQEAGFDASNL